MIDESMRRGDSLTLKTTLKKEDGSPLDMTVAGVKLWFTAKREMDDAQSEATISKTWVAPATAGGIERDTSVGANNVALTKILPADTAGLPARPTYLHCDLQLEQTGGVRTTVDHGTILVLPDVTTA